MDNLEQFFKKNKDGFEYIEPDANSWDEVAQTLDDEATVRNMNSDINRYWMKIAATLLLAVVALSFIYFQNNKNTQAINTNLVGLEESMYFPDLSLCNPDGQTIPLSTLKGKVVLVEFWASYCMLCTHEHCYYFKPLYNDYKDKGFEIYSVSADSSATNWVQAIERDGLDWIQVSDLLGNDSPVIQQYDVNGLPTNYLLDQDGKIIARNVDVAILEETLADLLALK